MDAVAGAAEPGGAEQEGNHAGGNDDGENDRRQSVQPFPWRYRQATSFAGRKNRKVFRRFEGKGSQP